ncbi:hypothetical protein HDU99_003071, partial [Rhizoclosmatium hyalinum]
MELNESSKKLIEKYVKCHKNIEGASALMEKVESAGSTFLAYKEKFDSFVESASGSDGKLSEYAVKAKETLDMVGQALASIAEAHPILNVVWIIGKLGYKMVKSTLETQQKFASLMISLKDGLDDIHRLKDSETNGIPPLSLKNLQKGINKYLECIATVVRVCECFKDPSNLTLPKLNLMMLDKSYPESKLMDMHYILIDIRNKVDKREVPPPSVRPTRKETLGGNSELDVTVQRYDETTQVYVNLPEKSIVCLKKKILEEYSLDPDPAIIVYYTKVKDTAARQLQMLSETADLSNVFKKVKDPQLDLLFVFHFRFIVYVCPEATHDEVVVELEEADVNLFLQRIAWYFGGLTMGTEVALYYTHSITNKITSVFDNQSLKSAITGSRCVYFKIRQSKTKQMDHIDIPSSVFQLDAKSYRNPDTPTASVAPKTSLDIWLNPVSFDTDLEGYAQEYVPGTRKWIIPALKDWANTGERVMYLNGAAGTGKSLIVYSLTKNLPSNFVIGALFICRYNDIRKSDPIVLVCSIVSSLCLSLDGAYKHHVEMEMEADFARTKEGKQSLLKSPVAAFKALVVEGLKKLLVSKWESLSLLIVIDALDELNKDTRQSVLTILTTLCPELPGFVKIITTGRPERDIYNALQSVSPFVLSPSDNNNTADLNVQQCCKQITEKAEGPFIYARNVCEYIKKQNLDPKQALAAVQGLSSGSDGVYRAIIERELQDNRAETLARFKRVFAVLLTVQRPLTVASLANLGGLEKSEVETVVAEFRSILKIEAGGMVSAIHKSVKDFFTDSRCGLELFIQVVDTSLAVRSLQISNNNLTRNMANLDPGKFYSKEELLQLDTLNEDVQYAVRFWSSHFSLGFLRASVEGQKQTIAVLYQFCTKTLIYYLEALLLLADLNHVFPMVQTVSDVLSSHTQWEDVKTVLSLMNDLKFVGINFRTQLLASPLQVYNHALIAVPQETLYYQLYQNLAPARITIGAEKEWGPFMLVGHSGDVNSAAYSPDSKSVVSGSGDMTVKLWSVETGECVKTFEGHSGSVRSVAFSPDSKTVVSGSHDNTVKLWSVETGELRKTLVGHFSWVTAVAYSPDGKTVVSGSNDNTVKLWDVETGKCLKTFEGHFSVVLSVAFSPDGKIIASGSGHRNLLWNTQVKISDKTVKLWSVETGELHKTLEGHSGAVNSVAFSPDSKTVVSGSEDKTVKLWSVETGKLSKTLEGHFSVVNSVAFSPDSKTVVSGSYDMTVKLWSVETGKLCQTLEGHSGAVNSVAFLPDSKTVVSGSEDKTVKLWSVETGKLSKTLEGHFSVVNSVAFSPDSKTVVSGSWDNTVKLWSVETGKLCQTLEGHSGAVNSVAFLPDSKTVVSGSEDKTVKLWS